MAHNTDKIKESLKTTEYYFVGVLAFVVIAIAVMLMVYIPSAMSLVDEFAETALMNASMANASAAETYFETRMTLLGAAAKEFAAVDISDADAVLGLCVKTVDSAELFRHVGFTNTDGITISSTGGSSNTTHRAFIIQGLAGEASLFPHINCDFDGKVCDMYTVPVRDANGELIGALSGECTALSLSDLTLIDAAGSLDCFYIIDPDGSIVYTSAGSVTKLRPGDDLITAIQNEDEANDVKFLLNSVAVNDLTEFSIDNVRYSASFASIAGKDWSFVSIVPRDNVYAQYGMLIGFTFTLIILMSGLLIISVIVVTVRIGRIKADIDGAISEGIRSFYVDSITGHDTIDAFRENYVTLMKDTATGHALISLDVDRFKAVNDMLGYEGGNEIIKRLSDIIKRNIGKNDIFARSSGDLFYILAEFSDKSELIDLMGRMVSDVEYQITEVKLDVSIGVYIIDEYNIPSRVAADRADMARDSIKNMKKSGFSFFDSSMLEKIRREKRIEDIMEDALALGEFLVYLQPKFGLGPENSVVGAEALVRWRHDGKLIPPGEFIPLFEKNGFVMKIDYFMFEEVCKLQKKYKTMGHEPKIISVNMSRLHIHKPGFVGELAAMCGKYGIDTKYFEIEITESAAFEDMDILCDIFKEIKSYGFHVSIDDFGTGYSSLNMLKDLPVDVLKIDRSFLTEDADEHENASIIIGCVVSLAASLNIRTICEGIETKEQASLLTKLGCNMAQGFFFARPMPIAEYEKLTYGIE